MKFKLDENLPAELVADLHDLGHDADTVVNENLCGESDPAVLEAARAAGRVLLTLDKGIANLQRYSVSKHACSRSDTKQLVGAPNCISYEVNPGHERSGYPPEARDNCHPVHQIGIGPIPMVQLAGHGDDTKRKCNTKDSEMTRWFRIE